MCPYDELQSSYEELQRRVTIYKLEMARLKEELEAAVCDAKEANENAVNFWGETNVLTAQLEVSKNKCQTAIDHALEVMVENKRQGAEIEGQGVEIERQGLEIQRQRTEIEREGEEVRRQRMEIEQKDEEIQKHRTEIEQKDVEIQNLCAENVQLRAQQQTEEDGQLFDRLAAICGIYTARLLWSQVIEMGGSVLEGKRREDMQHLVEGLEHDGLVEVWL